MIESTISGPCKCNLSLKYVGWLTIDTIHNVLIHGSHGAFDTIIGTSSQMEKKNEKIVFFLIFEFLFLSGS